MVTTTTPIEGIKNYFLRFETLFYKGYDETVRTKWDSNIHILRFCESESCMTWVETNKTWAWMNRYAKDCQNVRINSSGGFGFHKQILVRIVLSLFLTTWI